MQQRLARDKSLEKEEIKIVIAAVIFAALDVYLATIQEHADPLILQSAFTLLALLAGRQAGLSGG